MTEPQLSAEMEKDFQIEFGNVYSSKAGAKIGDELRVGSRCNVQLKHFLATALEEQKMKTEVETGLKNFQVTMEEIAKAKSDERQAVIEEIEGWLVARQLKNEREDEWTRGAYDELRELRAKLVEMKGGK